MPRPLAARIALGFALAATLPSLACRSASPPRPAPIDAAPADAGVTAARRRPVVIALVVDQLAAWIASERWPGLPKDGGFARLAREGTWVLGMRYAHAVTDTAPGHAALFSGAVPRESGIFGNEVVDATGEAFSVLRDEETRTVYPAAIAPAVSSSAKRLRVPTVADRLREAHPDSFTVGLSIKDRGAILPAGHRPTATVWFDTKQVRFVTSTAFAKELPAWVDAHGGQSAVLAALTPWTRLLPDSAGMTPDRQAGEGDESGLGTTFPHDLAHVLAPGRVFRTHPEADRTLLALALDALAAAPAAAPTLLSVSLSTHDYVGHVFGPDSVEAWEELARLDAALSEFFIALDARFGREGWYAILSADHGSISMPEAQGSRPHCAPGAAPDPWARPCAGGVRIDTGALERAVVRAATDAAGPGAHDVVRGVADPYVLMGDGARALTPAAARRVDTAIRGTLTRTAGVRTVFAVDALPATCPPLEGDDALAEDARIAALVCRSVAPRDGAHAGGYYVVTTPGAFFDARIVGGAGTSHGSPYAYDRTVPLLVRAPGKVPAGVRIGEPVDFRAFARTLASLVDVAPPPAASAGRDLTR